jgi:CubicO group peptidase (beta-lactamase class C family)
MHEMQAGAAQTLRADEADKEESDAARLTRNFYAGKVMPAAQLDLFRNRGWIFAQRDIPRGKHVRPLHRAADQIDDVTIATAAGSYDLVDYVSRNRVAGLLILHNGRVALEQYELGNDATTPWISMSVAKSVGTTLIGAAIRDGLIDSIEDLLTHYLPQLKNSAYDGVTVRHLLQMTTGLCWDETHTLAASERRHMLELQIEQKPGIVLRYLASRPRIAPSGTSFVYGTGDAHVIGVLLHAVTGGWVSDYLSKKIWSTIGMEHSAQWWLEAPGGLEAAGSGINATLRDYARFGQFFLEGGVVGTESILPPGWMREAGSSRTIGGKRIDYGYMWWPVPGRDGTFADGAFSARGIFGQYIYINPALQLVIVTLSARSKPRFAEVILDNDFFNAVADLYR